MLLAAGADQAETEADPATPTRVVDREPRDLLRGTWVGETVNQNDTQRKATLELPDGDFSAATGRFNNWDIERGEARAGRGGAFLVVLYSPGSSGGRAVEKPVTLRGRFDEEFTSWAGEFEGFSSTGKFELTRQLALPEAEALRGRWTGELTPKRRRDDAEPLRFALNLLTGDLTQATGVEYAADDHPPAESLTVTYYDPETREVDLRIAFAEPEDRRARAAREVVFQGVFDEAFTKLRGAYEPDSRGGGRSASGTFTLEKQVDN